jgi:broad specificity phosphatase PhoE
MNTRNPGRLILVRHGESEGNRTATFTRTPDVPLTELGEEQAREAGERILGSFRPTRIVASPFRRAQQTAALIAEVLGLGVDTEHDLRERDFGAFAGRPYDSIFADPTFDAARRWEWRPENGETLVEVSDRVVPAARRIAAAAADQDTVVVSHGGVMLALAAFFKGSWEGVSVAQNCGIIVVEHDGREFRAPALLDDWDEISPS